MITRIPSVEWRCQLSPFTGLTQYHNQNPISDKDVAVMVSVSYGDPGPEVPFGDCTQSLRDYVETFEVIRPFFASRKMAEYGWLVTEGQSLSPGERIHRIHWDGDRTIFHPPGSTHDFCHYCGTDNGAHGEHRVGWDCWNCGSN